MFNELTPEMIDNTIRHIEKSQKRDAEAKVSYASGPERSTEMEALYCPPIEIWEQGEGVKQYPDGKPFPIIGFLLKSGEHEWHVEIAKDIVDIMGDEYIAMEITHNIEMFMFAMREEIKSDNTNS